MLVSLPARAGNSITILPPVPTAVGELKTTVWVALDDGSVEFKVSDALRRVADSALLKLKLRIRKKKLKKITMFLMLFFSFESISYADSN